MAKHQFDSEPPPSPGDDSTRPISPIRADGSDGGELNSVSTDPSTLESNQQLNPAKQPRVVAVATRLRPELEEQATARFRGLRWQGELVVRLAIEDVSERVTPEHDDANIAENIKAALNRRLDGCDRLVSTLLDSAATSYMARLGSRRFGLSVSEANDNAQQATLLVLQKLPQYEDRGTPFAWLCAFMKKVTYGRLRARTGIPFADLDDDFVALQYVSHKDTLCD